MAQNTEIGKNISDDLNSGIYQRLRFAEKMLFKNRSAAADAANVGKSTFSRWIAGNDPSFEALARLADSVGLSLDWLASGRGEMHRSAGGGGADTFILVPQYDVQAAAGAGAIPADEGPLGFLSFRRDWVRRTLGANPASLAVITATGDSMEPTVRQGDLLLIDLSQAGVTENGVYVLEREGALLVKRLQFTLEGGLLVHSDNPVYRLESYSSGFDHGLRVVGRVRMISRAV
ncbi:MAG: S24 family peptidase [Alphaproteobacteria bacterium]